MKKKRNGQESQEGHIRISNRETVRYQTHRNGLLTLLGIGAVILFSLILLLLMKNYTDRRITQANDLLNRESTEYNELEKRIYERESFRRVFDLTVPNLVGVSASRYAFLTNYSKVITTGVIYDDRGFIIVPAEMVRGQEEIYVRTFEGEQEVLSTAYVIGVDEPSGLGLIKLRDLGGVPPLKPVEHKLSLAQTTLLIALPKGNPDTGNLTMGQIHSTEELFTIVEDKERTKLPVFLISTSLYFGNDGGAVVTMDGSLAGIASMELTERLGVSPYTAVVPSSELEKIVDRIQSRESFLSATFGLEGEMLKIPGLDQVGFYVLEVAEGSTAQRGGIQPTDIILTVDGMTMDLDQTLDDYIKGKKAGEDVVITLWRLNETLTFSVKIY